MTRWKTRALAYSLAEALDLPEDIAGALPPPLSGADRRRRRPTGGAVPRRRLHQPGAPVGSRRRPARPGCQEHPRRAGPQQWSWRPSAKRSRGTKSPCGAPSRPWAPWCRSVPAALPEKNRLEERIGELRRDIAVAQARRQDAAGRLQKFEGQYQKIDEERQEIRNRLGRPAG